MIAPLLALTLLAQSTNRQAELNDAQQRALDVEHDRLMSILRDGRCDDAWISPSADRGVSCDAILADAHAGQDQLGSFHDFDITSEGPIAHYDNGDVQVEILWDSHQRIVRLKFQPN